MFIYHQHILSLVIRVLVARIGCIARILTLHCRYATLGGRALAVGSFRVARLVSDHDREAVDFCISLTQRDSIKY
jgi:hypothetical protein